MFRMVIIALQDIFTEREPSPTTDLGNLKYFFMIPELVHKFYDYRGLYISNLLTWVLNNNREALSFLPTTLLHHTPNIITELEYTDEDGKLFIKTITRYLQEKGIDPALFMDLVYSVQDLPILTIIELLQEVY